MPPHALRRSRRQHGPTCGAAGVRYARELTSQRGAHASVNWQQQTEDPGGEAAISTATFVTTRQRSDAQLKSLVACLTSASVSATRRRRACFSPPALLRRRPASSTSRACHPRRACQLLRERLRARRGFARCSACRLEGVGAKRIAGRCLRPPRSLQRDTVAPWSPPLSRCVARGAATWAARER